MTIKEIETLSGLPRANIRYYESEGLISPKRAENGYREYSQADIDVLLRVKLLRALGLRIDTIKALAGRNAYAGRCARCTAGGAACRAGESGRCRTRCRRTAAGREAPCPCPGAPVYRARPRFSAVLAAVVSGAAGRRLSDRLFAYNDRLYRPCRRWFAGAPAKYDRKLYSVLRDPEAG